MANDQTATSTRRRFLGTAAGATGVAVAATVWPAQAAAAALPGEGSRALPAGGGQSFTGGSVGLELDGVAQGFLRSADGGDTFADVIADAGDQIGHKHIGNPKYEDFSLMFGFGLSLDFYSWVVGMVGGGEQWRRSGAILLTDLQRNVKSARGFQNSLITEFTIPACDASSKATAYLTLALSPESASDVTRTGTLPATTGAQKLWTTANFKLEIDGLDCTKVSQIGSITIKQSAALDRNEYPNLVVTFAASTLSSWKTWFNDFVVNGNNGDANEKNGRLTLLTNTAVELAVLQLHHVGIYKLDPDPEPSAGQEAVARATAELYVEAMNFTKLGPWVLT